MVNNIPVNGWPQLKDLEAVQPILNRLDKIEAWKRTVKEETFTGDDITIENALALPARSLITEINAIQPLHGYDHPWVGGAGKNKLPMTLASVKAANTVGTWSNNVYTHASVAWTVQTDSADNITGIKANGTATGSNSEFNFGSFSLVESTAYIVTDGTTDSGSNYNLRIGDHNNAYAASTSNGTANFTADSANTARLSVTSGYTISNKLFLPMIRLSTETDATFAPYSNICPISGRDSVVVTRSDGDEISEDFTIQLGTTVYGADINWDTGVATVTHVLRTITGDNVSNISPQSVVDTAGGKRININITDAKYCGSATDLSDIISDRLTAASANDIYSNTTPNRISVNDVGGIVLRYAGAATVEAAEVALNANPVQACYQLATTTTIQLTPTQLEMLKGYNRVTLSDGYGTIELKALTGANWS